MELRKINKQFNLAFVQLVCPSYKFPMYEGINNISNVNLTFFVGDKGYPGYAPGIALKNNWSIKVQNKKFSIFGLTFVWQSLSKVLSPKNYDLVILPEGIFYLSNYVTMFRCWWHKVPFGLYTHGFNYQRKMKRYAKLQEFIRAFIHRRCAVLIVYTEEGAQHLRNKNGVNSERIFIAKNTLDVESIFRRTETISPSQIAQCRLELGIRTDDVLLVYIGRIDVVKNPAWVVETVVRLRKRKLPIRAIFVGDGAYLAELQKTMAKLSNDIREAIKFIGRIPVEELDRYLLSGDITVMPGMTGLAIVHSFAVGRPYITIKSPYHSPEITYLQDGVNGRITEATVEAFCDAVASLAINKEKRQSMGIAALEYAKSELSMTNQIKGFEQAIDFIISQQA
jgi:glycosyltransferase involved in cell wall biosynthesis